MPRKPPPTVTVELIANSSENIDRQLNALYIRMVKRRLLDSGFTAEQKREVLKALNRIHRKKT